MPSLSPEFLQLLSDNYKKYPVFVESGTYKAETILAMEPYFDKLHTIEIYEQFWYDAQTKYTGNKICFHYADTEKFMPQLLPQIHENAIFFLDAHWSGVDTGLGEKTVPLYEELRAINRFFEGRAIIIIDDFRLFKTQHWEYINKSKVLECLFYRIEKVYNLPSELDPKDRLVIHIKPRIGAAAAAAAAAAAEKQNKY